MKKILYFNAMVFFMITISLLMLSSCNDKENWDESKRYDDIEYVFFDASDQLTITLEGITENIQAIDNPIDFLQVEHDGKNSSGFSMLRLSRKAATTENFEQGVIKVTFESNNTINLIISREWELIPSSENSGEYDKFNKGWWQEDHISYYTATSYGANEEIRTISLPWASSTISNIPREIFEKDDHSTTRGWVMAYNLFDSENSNGKRISKPYFALYNKYTGILRIFYYQFSNTGYAGELSFMVRPTSESTAKYPYYHSMQYAIPAGIAQAKNTALGCEKSNTYEQYYTPYAISNILKEGWYAFDIDMSHYNPAAGSLFQDIDYMSIQCCTSSTAQITLSGCFGGVSEGTTTSKGASTTSSANGINYNAAMTSGSSGAVEAFTCIMAGDYLTGAFKGAMALWNYGNALLGKSTDDYETIEETTGTISQNFNGEIDLSGYEVTQTSNNAIGVQFKYNAFSQSELVGSGVWSLQDSPVIYVVNDLLIGDDWGFSCEVAKDHYGYMGDPAVNNFNLFTFLDPTSLKFNINTEIYANIRNVEMSWTYGVYPNQPSNHTNSYRSLMRITNAAPQFIDKSKQDGKTYKSAESEFANMEYMDYPIEDMTFVQLDKKLQYIEATQTESKYRYFGCAGCEKDVDDKDFFIVDPVVTLPSEENAFYDFEVPDYVVGVTLKFNYTQDDGKECTAVFSKRFIPRVESITTSKMLTKRTELQKYSQSGTHQVVNGITISHKGADTMLKRFMTTSEYIKNYN